MVAAMEGWLQCPSFLAVQRTCISAGAEETWIKGEKQKIASQMKSRPVLHPSWKWLCCLYFGVFYLKS